MINIFIRIVKIGKKILYKFTRIFPQLLSIVWRIYKLYITSPFDPNIHENIKKGDYYTKRDPFKIVKVDPEKIVYHTVYDEYGDKTHFKDKVFDPWDDIGRVVGGDWDQLERRFEELPVYKSFDAHFNIGIKWEDTEFFKYNVKEINKGKVYWRCSSINDLIDRCKKIDLLFENIKKYGYKSQKEIASERIEDPIQKFRIIGDEITVNIGRNGDLFFNDGRHRLCIAKILKIKEVPVRILVRHENWQKFRNEIINYIDEYFDGNSTYELSHPDLKDIPIHYNSMALFDIIKNNLDSKNGKLLEVSADLSGFFCQKFEKLGFDCYALENDSKMIYFMEKFRLFNESKFKIINKSILDDDIEGKKFDVVLALNIFHHFLHKKVTFNKFLRYLKNLDTVELFLQCPAKKLPKMKNAYRQYIGEQFVKFIIENSNLNNFKFLGIPEKNADPLYKLTK